MNTRFWAKVGDGKFNEDGSPKYHSVICHLADTAAVAMEIVKSYLTPLAIERLSNGLGLTGESLIRFCGFMAGSHDLGKISPAFQFQVSEVGKILAGETLYDCWSSFPREVTKQKAPHGTVTAATLPSFLVEVGLGASLSTRLAKRLARRLSAIVGGHHGFFPSESEINSLDSAIAGTDERSVWQQHSRAIFQQLKDFVGLDSKDLPTQCDNAAAMLLAGLTTISDWIASNPEPETGFPYADDLPFAVYAKELEEKAKNALAKQGWTKQFTNNPLKFTDLFPFGPRDLQKAAIEISEELKPPCLVLIEASMGEGKTEAALYLADLFQQQGGVGGFYIGLPTQATSNAMFKRVREFLGKRYPQDLINLTLSHSAAVLKEEYRETICRLDQVFDEDKKVVASEWHTARKRTLLSPYGVGTIDQGLMGIVRSRHQFVRLFGLAGRTVILDEIHAYDIYTSTLLERFLEWLALLGSPVIALSATLPKVTRQGLLTAYARGCGCPDPTNLSNDPYPRITAVSSAGVASKSFEASDHVKRSLEIQWVKDQEWIDRLSEKLTDGGCVAIICSTVDRAQAIYQHLQPNYPTNELGLFHGRFLFIDREKIEKDCLARFGKDGERPKRFILVATQVIEQSLDVDFDLMISDLAPVDLLLQRSGRLHRHTRDKRPALLQKPELWLIEPTWDENGKIKFGESRHIYDRHILLRSWLTLRERDSIQLPKEMDTLIESVYELSAEIPRILEPDYIVDWQDSLDKYRSNRENIEKTKANAIKLPFSLEDIKPENFTRQRDEDDESTLAAVTRLGEPSVTAIFLEETDSGCVLAGSREPINLKETPHIEIIRKLLANSTRISKRGLVPHLLAQSNPKAWTSALLRHCRIVILDQEGSALIDKWHIRLDPLCGVVITKVV